MAAQPDDQVLEVSLDWRTSVTVMAAFVSLAALTALVRSAPGALQVLVLGGLLAAGLDGPVMRVQQRLRMPRGVAVGLVLGVLAAAVVALAVFLVPPATRQMRDLPGQVPRVTRQLADLPLVGDALAEADAPRRVEAFLDELPARLSGRNSPLVSYGRTAASSLAAAATVGVVTLALLLDARRLVNRTLSLVPEAQRPRARRLASLGRSMLGRYIAGSVFVAVLAGVNALISGLVLGLPLAPLLAVWIMVFNLVPQIGGAVGGVPYVALAFTVSPTTGVVALIYFLVYMQAENHLLQPLVVGRTIHLSPPATMTAALIGVSAAGAVGAMVAVPLVGALKAAYVELRPARGAPSP